jgi:hypothetical protein
MIPIRGDRRQHKRYLTLRNGGKALLVLVGLFALFELQARMRHGTSGDDYGRLFREQAPAPIDVRKVEPVREAPAVADQAATDPMLVAPAAREQYLGTSSLQPPVPEPQPTAPAAIVTTTTVSGDGHGITIVGGANGITIVRGTGKPPALSGGVFKKP